MKRYLLYIVIISLGTLLTPQALAKPTSISSTQNLNEIALAKPAATVLPAKVVTASVETTTPQPAQQTAPTQAVAPVQPVTPPAPSYPTDHVAIMEGAGISPSDFSYVSYILSHESGWCAYKWEGEVGTCPSTFADYYGTPNDIYWANKGYGLCQSTPAVKMSSAGADWQNNPVTQMKWCTQYAASRYGGWYNAYIHWVNNHNW